MKRIAVVGGGPSGLFAAFLLQQRSGNKLDITIFEGSGRLGGKVMTSSFAAAAVPYEAGVAELYRYGDDPLWMLVTRSLRLPVINMTGNMVVFEGRVLRDEADIKRHFGAPTATALAEFQRRGRAARPYKQFYSGGFAADNRHPWLNLTLKELLSEVPDETAKRYLHVLIHSDLATEPHLTHGLYGIDNYLINEGDYCQLYSIEEGISRLIKGLAERLSARVELNAPVSAIEKRSGGAYHLLFQRDGRQESEEFDAAVVALPIYSLRRMSWGDQKLRLAILQHSTAYEDPAHYLRITALFREPFWRGAFNEAWFIHDAFGGCCVYDEGKRHDVGTHGVLSWLLAGADALAMSSCTDEELIAKALGSLPEVLIGARSAFDLLIEGRVNRWIGMVYGMPAGKPVRKSRDKHRPEPEEHPGLVLVGDYLFDSTINGAFDSAEIASRLLLEHLST